VGASRLEGGIIGTLAYVAPEVWETEPAEIPADIYALGCITYEMLTGQALFADAAGGVSMMQAMHAHAQGPQFPATWPNGVPHGIEDVLRKALAWDKTTRYPTPVAFWTALKNLESQPAAITGAQIASMAAQWKSKAEDAFKAGKLHIAKMAVNQWLAAEPNDPEALKARDAIDQQMAQQAAAPAPAQQPSPATQQQAAPTPQAPAAQPVTPPAAAPPSPAQATPQVTAPPPAPQAAPTPIMFTFFTLPDQQTGTLANQYTVEQFLSTESHLDIYAADVQGQPAMLKWFFPAQATPEKRAFLEGLIQQGPPGGTPSGSFLWPTHIVESSEVPGFGFITPGRDSRFKSVEDLVKRWVEPSFHVLITSLLHVVNSFMALHLKGLCYSAISPRNVFFDPVTGETVLSFTDNVTNNGTIIPPDTISELRFMAPEIVRGEAPPSVQTDLYSLATLLFYMLMVHHPLDGEKVTQVPLLDLPAIQRLYGTDPVFIFDPNNDTNRPVPGYHVSVLDYWPLYPQFARDMFVQAFTLGLSDPYGGRIRESEWRKALVTMRDTIIYCPKCSAENFYDLAGLKATGGKPGACWACSSDLALPPRLRVGESVIMLNYNTKLYPHHIDPDKLYDFTQPVAEVTQHPQNPKIWGLKNLSGEKWVITTEDGDIKDVHPGRSLTLNARTKINFGKTEGEIRV